MDLSQYRQFNISVHVHKICDTSSCTVIGITGISQIEWTCQLRIKSSDDDIQLVIRADDGLEFVFQINLCLMFHILKISDLAVRDTRNGRQRGQRDDDSRPDVSIAIHGQRFIFNLQIYVNYFNFSTIRGQALPAP